MPYVPVPGTVLCEIVQQLDSQLFENTVYFHKAGAWATPDMVALADSLITWWTDQYRLPISSAVQLMSVDVTDLTTATSGAISQAPTIGTFGSDSRTSSPANVAPCISFHTAKRGRSFRGRNYITGICEADITINTVIGSVISALTVSFNELLDVGITNGAEWVVVSRFSGVEPGTGKPIPRAEGISTPILSASFTDNIVDSQRGRLPNH